MTHFRRQAGRLVDCIVSKNSNWFATVGVNLMQRHHRESGGVSAFQSQFILCLSQALKFLSVHLRDKKTFWRTWSEQWRILSSYTQTIPEPSHSVQPPAKLALSLRKMRRRNRTWQVDTQKKNEKKHVLDIPRWDVPKYTSWNMQKTTAAASEGKV